jgi:hypothetical protein
MVVRSKPKKRSAQHDVDYAEGGRGQTNKMFSQQAAGPNPGGRTGKIQSSAPGAKAAEGGPSLHGFSSARSAGPGQTGTDLRLRNSSRDYGK